jgi:putative endonuclease
MDCPYIAYILECSDHTLYIGSTNNLEKRLHAHNHLKSGAKYTRARRPVRLVHQEKFDTFSEAKKREAVLKKLTRQQKLELAAADQPSPSSKKSFAKKISKR